MIPFKKWTLSAFAKDMLIVFLLKAVILVVLSFSYKAVIKKRVVLREDIINLSGPK